MHFLGWQSTSAGEREVKQALRRTLLKYQLHKDQKLFDKAYGYIKKYYRDRERPSGMTRKSSAHWYHIEFAAREASVAANRATVCTTVDKEGLEEAWACDTY